MDRLDFYDPQLGHAFMHAGAILHITRQLAAWGAIIAVPTAIVTP